MTLVGGWCSVFLQVPGCFNAQLSMTVPAADPARPWRSFPDGESAQLTLPQMAQTQLKHLQLARACLPIPQAELLSVDLL